MDGLKVSRRLVGTLGFKKILRIEKKNIVFEDCEKRRFTIFLKGFKKIKKILWLHEQIFNDFLFWKKNSRKSKRCLQFLKRFEGSSCPSEIFFISKSQEKTIIDYIPQNWCHNLYNFLTSKENRFLYQLRKIFVHIHGTIIWNIESFIWFKIYIFHFNYHFIHPKIYSPPKNRSYFLFKHFKVLRIIRTFTYFSLVKFISYK